MISSINNNSKNDLFVNLIFVLFLLIRPFITLNLIPVVNISGINILGLFSLGMTYLFILFAFLRIRNLNFDKITILVLSFIFYVILSFLWGSDLRSISRLLAPLFLFYFVRTNVPDTNYLFKLYVVAVIGLSFPTVGSAIYILIGRGLATTVYHTGLDRYSGLYSGIHTLAHSSLILIPLLLLLYENSILKFEENKVHSLSMIILLFSSLYCMYKSYTRTTWIGTFIITNIYLFVKKRYLIMALLYFSIIIFSVTSGNLEKAFLDIIEPLKGQAEIGKIGSSRFGIWDQTIERLSKDDLSLIILGHGFKEHNETGSLVAITHNDYLGLLLTLGFVGLFIYLAILITIAIDIYNSELKNSIKYTYLGFVLAVIVMNLLSNSYISRIEVAQYFFFIIGGFYVIKDAKLKQ